MNLSDLLNEMRKSLTYDKLVDAADKVERFALNVETYWDALAGFVESGDDFVRQYVTDLRKGVAQLRDEAAQKTDGIYDDVRPEDFGAEPTGPTRDEKIAFIQNYFNESGLGGTGIWFSNPNSIDDTIVNSVYSLFGGK